MNGTLPTKKMTDAILYGAVVLHYNSNDIEHIKQMNRVVISDLSGVFYFLYIFLLWNGEAQI